MGEEESNHFSLSEVHSPYVETESSPFSQGGEPLGEVVMERRRGGRGVVVNLRNIFM